MPSRILWYFSLKLKNHHDLLLQIYSTYNGVNSPAAFLEHDVPEGWKCFMCHLVLQIYCLLKYKSIFGDGYFALRKISFLLNALINDLRYICANATVCKHLPLRLVVVVLFGVYVLQGNRAFILIKDIVQ